MELERGRTRWHYGEKEFWKRLRSYCKAVYIMNENKYFKTKAVR
jgi:hypothetical protein